MIGEAVFTETYLIIIIIIIIMVWTSASRTVLLQSYRPFTFIRQPRMIVTLTSSSTSLIQRFRGPSLHFLL